MRERWVKRKCQIVNTIRKLRRQEIAAGVFISVLSFYLHFPMKNLPVYLHLDLVMQSCTEEGLLHCY